MPRPTTKYDLLLAAENNFQKMHALIGEFGEQEILNGKIPFEDRDKNIRDILAHLHHWHLLFLGWYETGMQGQKPDMPATGYSWKTLPELNQKNWQTYQDKDYQVVKDLLSDSFTQIHNIIQQYTDTELFTKKYYSWTGSTSLGSYLISATSSHYIWAMKKLKRYKKYLTERT